MLKSTNPLLSAIFLMASLCFVIAGCNPPASEAQAEASAAEPVMTNEDYVLNGEKLVLVGGCKDCHSPKTFENGIMGFDDSRFLSGHPQGSQLPPIDTRALEPGYWLTFSPDLTAFVGPWGMSFARNLTPHETGIKGWTEEVFIKAMRTGKHMGVEQGRPIMPPMPWEILSEMSDEDLKSIYMYLNTIPAIDNRVPDPKSPDEVRAMAEAGTSKKM